MKAMRPLTKRLIASVGNRIGDFDGGEWRRRSTPTESARYFLGGVHPRERHVRDRNAEELAERFPALLNGELQQLCVTHERRQQ